MTEEVLYRGSQDPSSGCHVYAVRDGKELQLDDPKECSVSWGYYGTGPRNLLNLLVSDYYRDDPIADAKSQKARELFQSLIGEISQDISKWELTRRDIEFALLERPFKPTREELNEELQTFDNDELLNLIRTMKRAKRRWLISGAKMASAG